MGRARIIESSVIAGIEPVLFVAPSISAAQILTRRLARRRGALAAFWAMRPVDLAERIATPSCLAAGLRPWDSGHAALAAEQALREQDGVLLRDDTEAGAAARVLSRTLEDLRAAFRSPDELRRLAANRGVSLPEHDRTRLLVLSRAFEAYERRRRSFFDRTTLFQEATRLARDGQAPFVASVRILLSPELDPRPDELEFLLSLHGATRVERVVSSGDERSERPFSTTPDPFAEACDKTGIPTIDWAVSPLAEGGPRRRNVVIDLQTAPGESAEVRAVARAILREAKDSMPLDEIGLVIPQPDIYAPIVADVFSRAAIPYRLHPSLPLSFGRIARSFLLLLRSRRFDRASLMEFLTFAPAPLAEKLSRAQGETPAVPHPSVYDALTRELRVVSGIDRFRIALKHFLNEEVSALESLPAHRRLFAERRVAHARQFLELIDQLDRSFAALSGLASFGEWSKRLLTLLAGWIRPEDSIEAEEYALVRDVLEDLASLDSLAPPVAFEAVERVIESRFEWKRKPMENRARVGVHVGSPEALLGARLRRVFVVGLVEGRFPGVFRPDPFLLDTERDALNAQGGRAVAPESDRREPPAGLEPSAPMQRRLFEDEPDVTTSAEGRSFGVLETTATRVHRARRTFARLFDLAEERLTLSYPRADEHTGRERLPSLFLAVGARRVTGKSITAAELAKLVTESDEAKGVDLDLALDLADRDLQALDRFGPPVLSRIEADRPFLKAARDLARGRAARVLTAWDGFVGDPSGGRLDPRKTGSPMSASRLGSFGECGFRYFLQHVLKLEPALDPEERRRLDPLEKGTLFHEVAEIFLRSRRDRGLLPVRNTEPERAELRALAQSRLDAFVAGSPPRLLLLWRAEKKMFLALLDEWLKREATPAEPPAVPAHFEVGFGLFDRTGSSNEPHRAEPVEVTLASGERVFISGKIDRIDRVPESHGGGLILRDYKTGKAPLSTSPSDQAFLKGGRQLQIPFYVLAAAAIFPGEKVRGAFLDFVNRGIRVPMNPEHAMAPSFRALLMQILDLVAQGAFVQDPSACAFCDFQTVCGPRNLIEIRRRAKQFDETARKVFDVKRFA